MEKSPEKPFFHNDIDDVSGNTDEKEQKAGLPADRTVHGVRAHIHGKRFEAALHCRDDYFSEIGGHKYDQTKSHTLCQAAQYALFRKSYLRGPEAVNFQRGKKNDNAKQFMDKGLAPEGFVRAEQKIFHKT